ncbi:unnamed protein product, partial [Symbiodinium pilosum]
YTTSLPQQSCSRACHRAFHHRAFLSKAFLCRACHSRACFSRTPTYLRGLQGSPRRLRCTTSSHRRVWVHLFSLCSRARRSNLRRRWCQRRWCSSSSSHTQQQQPTPAPGSRPRLLWLPTQPPTSPRRRLQEQLLWR